MIAVIQRVSNSHVTIGGLLKSSIGKGLTILLGIEEADGVNDIEWLANKIINLRIFNDAEGVMNVSVKDAGGEILLVSQFTLHGLQSPADDHNSRSDGINLKTKRFLELTKSA